MIDLPWKVFSKTGSVETYLLMKQMEEAYQSTHQKSNIQDTNSKLVNNGQ
ncbi:YqzL family protein [Aquisalibacillus elongatus]|uniref:YqzL-like protein n=1 Tax=Aquisalibacillus elongatus TaxID=485577 RepID=A0A3N5BK14_9BACI|nr:YqzL family protein [Aquisalibacillus elongatus]RPF55600.1 YqzL-like protein [Aquisalibacillus elongatus]